MRAFLAGAFFVLVLAMAMEAAHAQSSTYTNEDLLNVGILGIGALLIAAGFFSGKQR